MLSVCVRFLCSVLHMQYHVLSLVLIQRYYNVIITEEFFQPIKEEKKKKNTIKTIKKRKDVSALRGRKMWWLQENILSCISHLPQQEDEIYLHQTDS